MSCFPKLLQCGATLLGLAVGTFAKTAIVNFDPPAYKSGNLSGQNGWGVSGLGALTPANTCTIPTGQGANQSVTCKSEGYSTLQYRFESDTAGLVTTPKLLLVSWRWQPQAATVRECLSVAGSGDGDSTEGRNMSKVGVCFFANGAIQIQGDSNVTSQGAAWSAGKWNYLWLLVDEPAKTWSLYYSLDSLGADRKLAGTGGLKKQNAAVPPVDLGPATRVVLRSEVGTGNILFDDLGWETATYWKAPAGVTDWSTAGNWYGGAVPDANTYVIFDATSSTTCKLSKSVKVKSIIVADGYAGTIDIDTCGLTVIGNADFSAGNYTYSPSKAGIRFSSAFSQSLIGPAGFVSLPPVIHDGAGRLRLDARALQAAALTDSAGIFDFNGFDLVLAGSLRVTKGGPNTFANLGGRHITLGAASRLSGSVSQTLGLSPAAPWQITHKSSDTLVADYAVIGKSRASVNSIANHSQDGGNDTGWIFAAKPEIKTEPSDTAVISGQDAVFRVSVTSNMPVTYQWYKGSEAIPGKTDTILTVPKAHLSDGASRYRFIAANTAGSDTSAYALLQVSLPSPDVQPHGGAFRTSIDVALLPPAPGTPMRFSLNGGPQQAYTQAITLTETTHLVAVAAVDADVSGPVAYDFTKSDSVKPDTLKPPAFTSAKTEFADTMSVTLAAERGTIRYTTDGSQPSESSTPYGGAIHLDTSAIITAAAFESGWTRSPASSRTFYLVAATPEATPGGGQRQAAIQINLTTSTSKAEIRYTLDKTVPTPTHGIVFGAPFKLDTNATLQALAVTGHGALQKTSGLLSADYTFDIPVPGKLSPGGSLDLGSGYVLVNSSPSLAADVVVLNAVELKDMEGFTGVKGGVHVTRDSSASDFPTLVFRAPAGDSQTFYRSLPGSIRYIDRGDSLAITDTGTYFIGLDTAAPKLSLVGEDFTAEGATQVKLSIRDNVANLLLTVIRSDSAERDVKDQAIEAPETLTVVMKNPGDTLRSLDIRARASDRSRRGCFPSDSDAVYSLRQKTGPVHGPSVLRIGSDSEEPWDLVSIPLPVDPPFTLADLRTHNHGADSLAAGVWNDVDSTFHYLSPADPLEPGKAYWLGQWKPLKSFAFHSLQTVPRGQDGAYLLTLKKGWNQVANPTLRALYWPVSWKLPDAAYDASPLKGLHAHDPATGFAHVDSLPPWKGCYVRYGGDRDTEVTLLSAPAPTSPAPKAAAAGGLMITLSLPGAEPVRLGASTAARDAVGSEDDPQPPTRASGSRAALSALRGGARLGVDMLRWNPRALLAWKVIARAAADSKGAAASLASVDLPEGFSAWAVSARRGLRFPLRAGGSIPLPPGFADSLDVYAGPADLIEKKLGGVPVEAGPFRCDVAALPGGFSLRLHLPGASSVLWSLWTPAGRLADQGRFDLPAGVYAFDRPGRKSAYLPGMYLLRVTRGGADERVIRKLALP